jgi:hypothetical protein
MALFAMQDTRRCPSEFAAIGTIFHRFAHRAIEWMREKKESRIPIEVAMEFLNPILAQIDVPDNEVVPLSMQGMEQVRILVSRWCEDQEFDISHIHSVEQRISVEIDVPRADGTTYKRTITGQLDVLIAAGNGTAVIGDHKTGWKKPVQPRDGEDDPDGSQITGLSWPQSTIYSLLVLLAFPSVQKVVFVEWAVRWNERRIRVIERFQLERLRDIVTAQVAALDLAIAGGPESKRWTEMAGSHCSMCANPRACPIAEQVGVVYDRETALKAYNDWHVSGEVRKDRRTFLGGYVDVNGPLQLPDGKLLGWEPKPDGKRNFGIYEQSGTPEEVT